MLYGSAKRIAGKTPCAVVLTFDILEIFRSVQTKGCDHNPRELINHRLLDFLGSQLTLRDGTVAPRKREQDVASFTLKPESHLWNTYWWADGSYVRF